MLTSPDLGAWGSVITCTIAAIEVEDNTLIVVGIVLVEVKVLRGLDGSVTADFNLDARRVELSTTLWVLAIGCIGFVEADELIAEKVFAGNEGGGDGNWCLSLVGNQIINSPLSGFIVISVGRDFCPDGFGGVAIGIRGNPCLDGAFVRGVDDIIPTAAKFGLACAWYDVVFPQAERSMTDNGSLGVMCIHTYRGTIRTQSYHQQQHWQILAQLWLR